MGEPSTQIQTYLGKRKIHKDNVLELYQRAKELGAEQLTNACISFVFDNFSVDDQEVTAKLPLEIVHKLLRSDTLNATEDNILRFVLSWCASHKMSQEQSKGLVELVRLPFVPVESPSFRQAVEEGLVSDDMRRICNLFQIDGDYRSNILRGIRGSSDSSFRPRLGRTNKGILQRARVILDWEDDDRRIVIPIMRMMGVVNGRHGFDKISTIEFDQTSNHLVYTGIQSNAMTRISPRCTDIFNFASICPMNPPTNVDQMVRTMDQSNLSEFTLDEVEKILAKLLRRENEIRLHPAIQAEYGRMKENESEMSHFTTELQRYVCQEFNVDPNMGIELIRSATVLFPETAKLAHYVRYNRCVPGTLCVGDHAPDVCLSSLDSKQTTTLWTAIDPYRGSCNAKPVLILGASYT
jgi:hypothetical protein